jgi:adenylate kinase
LIDGGQKRSGFVRIILLGAPGAGKGTQAEVICDKLSIPTISTGNIIREALKSGSEMGNKAKAFVEAGKLVPDEVVIGIIQERLEQDDCKNGFILDGFPRTIPQAEALDKMDVAIDRVIDIEVPDEKIVLRMSGRRVCEQCGASYHTAYKPSAVEGVCDKCGGTLVQRKDDHPDTVQERLRVYHEETEPLKAYYEKQGKLVIVEGQEDVKDTTRLTLAALEA